VAVTKGLETMSPEDNNLQQSKLIDDYL